MAKFHIKDIQRYFSPKQWMLFWYQHYKAMFFSGFLVVLALGGYFWYKNLYQYQWSQQRKNQFIEKNFKSTAFQEKRFRELVEELRERARHHEERPFLSRDIFTGRRIE